MIAVNYTTLRENMKSCMDKVTDDYETLIVTRKDNKNVDRFFCNPHTSAISFK